MEPIGGFTPPPALVELCVADLGEGREWLHHVWLDMADGADKAKLVATNGSGLLVAPVVVWGQLETGPLPIGILEDARSRVVPVEYFGGGQWGLDSKPTPPSLIGQPIFNWRKLVPRRSKTPDVTLDASMLETLGVALNGGDDMFGGVQIACTRNQDGSVNPEAVAYLEPDPRTQHKAFALIMPIGKPV